MTRTNGVLRYSLLTALAAFATACTSQQSFNAPKLRTDAALTAQLDPMLHELDSGGAIVSARIVELPSGDELYSTHPDDAFTPASNMKLQTVSAALDRFGPDHVFKTYLALDGDDLWLIGTGDPACGDSNIEKKHGRETTSMLDDWSEALKARGTTQVKGKLYFYDGTFDDQRTLPSWGRGELIEWYAAPVSGLIFNDDCIDVIATPTMEGQPAKLEVIPPTAGNKIINDTMTMPKSDRETVDIRRRQDENVFVVGGRVTARKELQSKPVTDPGAFFADALRTNLASHGITIVGNTERAAKPLGGKAEPPQDKIVAVHESSMADVLARVCKNSQNLFAEALSKYDGRAYELEHGHDAPGSWKAGSDAAHEFLRRNHIDDSKFVMVDGSGLSHSNKVTTRLITDELRVMWSHKDHEIFFNSLAVGGKDGTIGKRMDDLQGHVFGKTGFVNGVRALSGYVKTNDDKWMAFSIIFNKLPGGVEPAEDIQDNVCRVLVDYPKIDDAKLRPVRPAGKQED